MDWPETVQRKIGFFGLLYIFESLTNFPAYRASESSIVYVNYTDIGLRISDIVRNFDTTAAIQEPSLPKISHN